MHTAHHPAAPQFSRAGVIWLKLAVTYLIAGVALGIVMGATKNFALMPVHAHLNLLGWATLALAGLIYSVFPVAGASRLARIHFWCINLSMPVMLGSLAVLLLGNPAIEPVLALSQVVAAAGILAFAANIYLNLGKTVDAGDEAMEAYAPARPAPR